MTGGERVAAAWRQAADDLGVRGETEESLSDSEGRQEGCAVVLPDFGGPGGAAVLIDDPIPVRLLTLRRAASNHGLFISFVSDEFETYDRDLFIRTLNDWQWHGMGDPPPWYAGGRSG